MGQRISEELEAALAELEKISLPSGSTPMVRLRRKPISRTCELHNQTMTITTIVEKSAA